MARLIQWVICILIGAWSLMVGLEAWHAMNESVPNISYNASLSIALGLAFIIEAGARGSQDEKKK